MVLKYHEETIVPQSDGEAEMAMNKVVSIVRADGEGEKLWFYGGGVHTWKATSAETGAPSCYSRMS